MFVLHLLRAVNGTKDEFAATQKNGPVLGVLLTLADGLGRLSEDRQAVPGRELVEPTLPCPRVCGITCGAPFTVRLRS